MATNTNNSSQETSSQETSKESSPKEKQQLPAEGTAVTPSGNAPIFDDAIRSIPRGQSVESGLATNTNNSSEENSKESSPKEKQQLPAQGTAVTPSGDAPNFGDAVRSISRNKSIDSGMATNTYNSSQDNSNESSPK